MIILIDESVLNKDYHMDSNEFKAIRKYGSVTLCQVVLDNVLPKYLEEYGQKALDEYNDFLDSFMLDNGNVYPESYPTLTDTEQKSSLANDSAFLFWKNCLYILKHYVLEDIHVVSENQAFFSKDSELYSIIQNDIKKDSKLRKNRLFFWNGVTDFFDNYIEQHNKSEDYLEKIRIKIEKNTAGFQEPLKEAVSDLILTEDIDYKSIMIEEYLISDFKRIDETNVLLDVILNGYGISVYDDNLPLELYYSVKYDIKTNKPVDIEFDGLEEFMEEDND